MADEPRDERQLSSTPPALLTVRSSGTGGEAASDSQRQPSTVRCAAPEEAAATMRLSAEHRRSSLPAAGDARYETLGMIAKGGMSTVTEAHDRLILRRVAVKELDASGDISDVTRLLEEAQITGQLDHPNIVPIYDLQSDSRGMPCRFTMKLVEGQTLYDMVRSVALEDMQGLALEELLGVFLKVCDAVSFAHERGVIHRDLKPGNVMVGSHGQVYLMDWGIALLQHSARASLTPGGARSTPIERVRTGSQTIEEAGTLCGTPAYMAPEQALGRVDEIDARTDVYGLGGILYFMLTRRPPHDAPSAVQALERATLGEVTDPVTLADHVKLPPGLVRIAMKALAPARSDRHGSVDDLKRDVDAFLHGGGWFMTRKIPKGTLIIREGDPADEAYILTEGHCKLFRTVDGREQFIRLFGPGEVFGETAIFSDSPRNASVETTSDVTVLVVTREALERELDRSVWMRAFVEAVTERFLEHDRKLSRIGRDSGS
jgi:serine/threonine protein kinase